jgi:hypothetical protein
MPEAVGILVPDYTRFQFLLIACLPERAGVQSTHKVAKMASKAAALIVNLALLKQQGLDLG